MSDVEAEPDEMSFDVEEGARQAYFGMLLSVSAQIYKGASAAATVEFAAKLIDECAKVARVKI